MTSAEPPVWQVISHRLSERGWSSYELAKRLAAVTGNSAETERKNIQRWGKGREPRPPARVVLAEVLGGSPDDYQAPKRQIVSAAPLDPPAEWLDLVRAEVVGDVLLLARQVPALTERLQKLEARVAQIEVGQAAPTKRRNSNNHER